ncbi:MAG: hypothetical protein PVH96_14855, partial [Gemmatimonadota bacterium]
IIAVGLTLAAGTTVEAQASWTGTVLPYEDASRDVLPTFAFATDPVVEIMDVPPLRGVSLPPGMVELRIWVGFGVVIPHLLLRLTERNGDVQAEFVRWWGMMDHPSSDVRLADFLPMQRALAGGFGCNERQNGSDWTEVRLDRTRVAHTGWTFACKADFGVDEPDWSVVFRRLSSLRVADLPDPETLTPEPLRVNDGTSVEVEVLRGTDYRSYTYGNPDYQPWPEARSAEAIIAVIQDLHALGR